jgi:activator of 2-hydroxyglutaryl-CoA dehydratase
LKAANSSDEKLVDTSFDPLKRRWRLLDEAAADTVVATGYGRHLLEVHADIRTISEG